MSEILNQILPSLIQILATFIGLGIAAARSGLTNMIQQKIKNSAGETALIFLNDAVFTAVSEFNQTMVGQLKSDAANGKLSPEAYRNALSEAKSRATDKVLSLTADKLKTGLGLDAGQSRALIDSKIEATIHQSKQRPQ